MYHPALQDASRPQRSRPWLEAADKAEAESQSAAELQPCAFYVPLTFAFSDFAFCSSAHLDPAGTDIGLELDGQNSEAMDEDGWTVVESRKTRQRRTSQEIGPTSCPPKYNRVKDGQHNSKKTTRPSSAKDLPAAQIEQDDYIPQNHRIYSPLNRAEQEIRILVLKAGQPHMPLKCRLLQRSLEWAEKTGFETISYCWGNSKERDTIEVQGLPLRVPDSAIELLQQFRYPNKDRLLWIDSICLNQLDLEERGHEVARMHHIYSRGQRNLIWLGPDDGTAAAAQRALCTIMEDIGTNVDVEKSFYKVLKRGPRPPKFPQHLALCENLALPFLELLARPWFTRVWVVQEAAFSKHNVIFCGSTQMELIVIMRLHFWLSMNGDHLEEYGKVLPELVFTAFRALNGLFHFTDREYGGLNVVRSKEHWMLQLLEHFQELDASDARDHVYGFLGLNQGTKDGELLDLLKPDYSKDTLTVFRDATRYAIYQEAGLGILDFNFHKTFEDSCSEREALSWVPRWSRKWDGDSDHQAINSQSKNFDAGMGTKVDKDICWVLNSDTIVLRGLFIDQPGQVVVTGQSEICECEDLADFFDEVLRFVCLDTLSNVPGDASSVLWRVLVAGIDHDRQVVDESMAHTFQAFWRYYQEHDALPVGPVFLPEDASDELLAMSNYRDAMSTACHRRRLFTTVGGHVGLGPQTMRPGDVAVILYGGKAPFILRYHEDANDYEFIGDCYIDGIMFGEAVQKHREEGREDVIFNIR